MPSDSLRRIKQLAHPDFRPVAKSMTEPTNSNPLAEEHDRLPPEPAEQTFPKEKIPHPDWAVRLGSPKGVSTDEPVARCDPTGDKPVSP